MTGFLIFILALLPIATVFLLLVVLERSDKLSMFVAYLVTAATALLVWGTDLNKVLGATANGAITAISLLYIIFGAILLLFTLALTWLAVIPGLTARSVDGASSFAYPLIFLPFVSSAFAPTESMPAAVRAFAEHQPVTSIVNALRALLAVQPVGDDLWLALGWCSGLLVLAYAGATLVYRRKLA